MSLAGLLNLAAQDPTASYTTLSVARLLTMTAALIGVVGVAVGWVALTRARKASARAGKPNI